MTKIESPAKAKAPFYEPGFEGLLEKTPVRGVCGSPRTSPWCEARVHFVCVATPQKRGEYAADLRYVESATESLLDVLASGDLVVGQSTSSSVRTSPSRTPSS